MKQIFTVLVFLFFATFAQASNVKLEGACYGDLIDGSRVSFYYYSNFNGCQKRSTAVIRFFTKFEPVNYKGKRTFQNDRDIYTFDDYRVSFKDSTGNTDGIFSYYNDYGWRRSVKVKCVVLDYEFEACQ